ncbi:hypothetical protein BLNAU_22695 [Blattamonas nauphoetae]|uniref:Uncharacterized protein n=1 Tax=Blattamonas nauphoetae TaxID=2049346 RepID=A0ABQ9WTE3_9EUKA|nr:hypothetical protein BLNAU_22695 [Blattamonas nauphoetae]
MLSRCDRQQSGTPTRQADVEVTMMDDVVASVDENRFKSKGPWMRSLKYYTAFGKEMFFPPSELGCLQPFDQPSLISRDLR